MPSKGKLTQLVEGEGSIERVIGSTLRATLLSETGLLTVRVEVE